ncbi:leucine-rich repeat protein soc-2 homolog [Watersipora subatra]|uniref:leucine-rich repeat protein soc-2 homolog n=1 Tax=Watersipora subatra TaxID=2589382 RepID=UPI00355B4220
MDSNSSHGGKAKATKRKISAGKVKYKKAATRSSTSSQRGKADAKKKRVLFEDVKDKKELVDISEEEFLAEKNTAFAKRVEVFLAKHNLWPKTGRSSIIVSVNRFVIYIHKKKEVECLLIQNKMEQSDWESLTEFTQLEELYIVDQDLSEGLPPVLHTLNTLKMLSLGRCRMKAIPESLASLTGLTEFHLFTNDFSEGLPEAVCRLTSLTTLKIYDNKLTNLPDRLSRLTQLEVLDISVNNMENVPRCVFKLANLKKLTIGSEKLKKIGKEILDLTHLTELDLKNCLSLEDPSFDVWPGGLTAIINHYTNSESGRAQSPVHESEKKKQKYLKIDDSQNQSELERLSDYPQLEELKIIDQDLSEGLPLGLLALNSLTALILGRCRIKTIPESYHTLPHRWYRGAFNPGSMKAGFSQIGRAFQQLSVVSSMSFAHSLAE